VLVVEYKECKIYIYPVELDKYQMKDLCRDVKNKILRARLGPPKNFSFTFESPTPKRMHPLKSDHDWTYLGSVWENEKGEISLVLEGTETPSVY